MITKCIPEIVKFLGHLLMLGLFSLFQICFKLIALTIQINTFILYCTNKFIGDLDLVITGMRLMS